MTNEKLWSKYKTEKERVGIANFLSICSYSSILFFSTVQNGKQKCEPMMEKVGKIKPEWIY